MARRGPTRSELTAAAFLRAERRGLSRRELVRVAGRRYEQILEDLREDGFIIVPRPSRYDGKPWRWIGYPPIAEPDDAAAPDAAPALAQAPEQLDLPVASKPEQNGGVR